MTPALDLTGDIHSRKHVFVSASMLPLMFVCVA